MKAEEGKCVRQCPFSKSESSDRQQKGSSAVRVMTCTKKPRRVIFYLWLENNEQILHENSICAFSCLPFNHKPLSLQIRCINETFCFFHDCLGIVRFSLMSVLWSTCHSPFWAEIILQPGSRAVLADKTHHKTTGPGRPTGLGPVRDNCFSSSWGEQLNDGGKIIQSSWEPCFIAGASSFIS